MTVLRFLRRLLRNGQGDPATPAHEDPLLTQYRAFLMTRLAEYEKPVCAAFERFFAQDHAGLPERLRIEVFQDEPGFAFRLFGEARPGEETPQSPALAQLNAEIEALWPIVIQEEMDRFIVWEDDPKWGRQEALAQPTDHLDLTGVLVPWFTRILQRSKGSYRGQILFNQHDLGQMQSLSAGPT